MCHHIHSFIHSFIQRLNLNPNPDYESVDLPSEVDQRIHIHWITQNALQNNGAKLCQEILMFRDFCYIYSVLSSIFILDSEIKKIAFHKSNCMFVKYA